MLLEKLINLCNKNISRYNKEIKQIGSNIKRLKTKIKKVQTLNNTKKRNDKNNFQHYNNLNSYNVELKQKIFKLNFFVEILQTLKLTYCFI